MPKKKARSQSFIAILFEFLSKVKSIKSRLFLDEGVGFNSFKDT